MEHDPLEAFMQRFVFSPQHAWKVGVERELFIRDISTRVLMPSAPLILGMLWDEYPELQEQFGYELSACQLETRTTEPHYPERLRLILEQHERIIREFLGRFGYEPQYDGVGPEDMPVAVFPDERYLQIAASNPNWRVLAACRIIGTHIHVGMPDVSTALRVYNYVCTHLHGLRLAANKTNGVRTAIYRQVVEQCEPVPFATWSDHHRHALEHDYAKNLRNNWMQVRITRYGTIEFRLFDGTASLEQIVAWARECVALCRAGSTT